MDSTAIAARHRLVLPTELMLFFKSIVTVEGMAKFIVKDFNLLNSALEFAEDLVKTKYSPDRIKEEASLFGRDASTLLRGLPRHLKQFVRKVGHPDFAFRVELVELEDLKRSIETSSNIVFLGLIIGSLILSASLVAMVTAQRSLIEMPILSILGYSLAGALSLVAFYNYIKK
jgi:ubiquinone biosynthesis protein